jgi:hypothetical protein
MVILLRLLGQENSSPFAFLGALWTWYPDQWLRRERVTLVFKLEEWTVHKIGAGGKSTELLTSILP